MNTYILISDSFFLVSSLLDAQLAALFVLYSLFSLKTKSWALHDDWQQRQEAGIPRWEGKRERSPTLQVHHPAEAGEVAQLQASPGALHEKSSVELVNSSPPPPPPQSPSPPPPPLLSSPTLEQEVDEGTSPFGQSPLAKVDTSWPVQGVDTQQPSAHEQVIQQMPTQHDSVAPQEKSESSTASSPPSKELRESNTTTTVKDLQPRALPPQESQVTETAAHRRQVLIPKLEEKSGAATTAVSPRYILIQSRFYFFLRSTTFVTDDRWRCHPRSRRCPF